MTNAYKLATCIALHRLSLAVSSIMIWSTALVTSGWTRSSRSSGPSTTETTPVSSTRTKSSPTGAYRWSTPKRTWTTPLQSCTVSDECIHWVTIVQSSTYSKMAGLATSVAAASSSCSAYAQRRAISLHMAETLAMIALFRCCSLSASVAECRDFGSQDRLGARTLGGTRQRAPVGFMP